MGAHLPLGTHVCPPLQLSHMQASAGQDALCPLREGTLDRFSDHAVVSSLRGRQSAWPERGCACVLRDSLRCWTVNKKAGL